ncbi:MAG: immunoglobulin domain-containing protein [Bacteroidota bacterium]
MQVLQDHGANTIPTGTTLGVSVRTGNTAVPDGTWSAFTPISASGNSVGRSSQYIQYKADLATTDTKITPALHDILIQCSSPPSVTLHPTSQPACNGADVTFTSSAIGFPVPTVQWEVSTNGTIWTPVGGATNSTLTFAVTAADNNKQYRAVWTGAAIVNSNPATLTVNLIPSAPTVTVSNNCGSSVLTASNFTGNVIMEQYSNDFFYHCYQYATYTVTQTVNGCVSPAGSGTSAPKAIPSAPSVTVVNNCGTSLLTAGNYAGTLLWSNGAVTESITVSASGTYTVAQR